MILLCKKKIAKVLILGLLITSSSTMLPKTQIVQAASKNNINYIKTEFNELNYTDYLNVKNEINKLKMENSLTSNNERGFGSMTAKVAMQLLKKYKTKIVSMLKKLPYGAKLASLFLDKFDFIINALNNVTEGVEGAIRNALISCGLSYFWADLLADAIMTILGILI